MSVASIGRIGLRGMVRPEAYHRRRSMSWPPQENSIDLSGPWEIRRDDETSWQPIAVPGAWQHTLGVDFHGTAWYRRRVELPAHFLAAHRTGRRFWLRFLSVATDLRAWVNEIEVGRHIGDYVPFQFDVTHAMTGDAVLQLMLRVDEVHAPKPERDGDLQNGHITKGFHDVISLQHGGIWQSVHLAYTGEVAVLPDGVAIRTDASTGRIDVEVEVEPGSPKPARVGIDLFDPEGAPIEVSSNRIDSPRPWSPDQPALYRAIVRLHDVNGVSETHDIHCGFRRLQTEGRTILLNDRPLLIRGVLDWGHEPQCIAPAPTPDEVRARFDHLRAMGFNTVCLCMWYPPRWFFDIADETGMLIWQEHPMWQAPMKEAHLPEYRRLYESFLRRDRNHPSIAIVSATCEHPSFHPGLSAWWWDRARRELPSTLLEVQTAFFRWADHEKTDLYDEHTYDNCDRWVSYIDDVHAHTRDMDPKPFVMGETILFTSWPDVEAIGDAWWRPRGLDHMRELEETWRLAHGESVVARFKRQADRYHLLGRQFQVEQFRRVAAGAGLVMNHLRDVPQCQCGLMDDLDCWRFEPDDTRGWMDDASLLLWTPDHRRCFSTREAENIACRLAMSNFGEHEFDGQIAMRTRVNDQQLAEVFVDLRCARGEVNAMSTRLSFSAIDRPARFTVEATAEGLAPNSWDLWVLPEPAVLSDQVCRLADLPFLTEESTPDAVEQGYSRGYGLAVRSWESLLPDPARLAPGARPISNDELLGQTPRVLLTHRLTRSVLAWIAAGGRAILFASKARGGLGTSYEWLFGGVPLIIEGAPLHSGDSEWIVDALPYDLTRRYARVIPSERLGLLDAVDPIIRLVYTHDQERVQQLDLLCHAPVGAGHLTISSLDHSEAAGQFLLGRMIDHLLADKPVSRNEIDPTLLGELTYEACTR